MKLYDYLLKPTENPLDNIPEDGGFSAIFRTIACIGDSLSSGEFESRNPDGSRGYHDMFEYSWGQFIARQIGAKVYNFSRGGMTAIEYVKSFAEANDMWSKEKLAQAGQLNQRQREGAIWLIQSGQEKITVEAWRKKFGVVTETARQDLLMLKALGLLTRQLEGRKAVFIINAIPE